MWSFRLETVFQDARSKINPLSIPQETPIESLKNQLSCRSDLKSQFYHDSTVVTWTPDVALV